MTEIWRVWICDATYTGLFVVLKASKKKYFMSFAENHWFDENVIIYWIEHETDIPPFFSFLAVA